MRSSSADQRRIGVAILGQPVEEREHRSGQGGRIVGPVRNLRFTMSYLDALANVEAVSRDRRCIRGFLGGSVVPSLRLSSFSFTGATAAG